MIPLHHGISLNNRTAPLRDHHYIFWTQINIWNLSLYQLISYSKWSCDFLNTQAIQSGMQLWEYVLCCQGNEGDETGTIEMTVDREPARVRGWVADTTNVTVEVWVKHSTWLHDTNIIVDAKVQHNDDFVSIMHMLDIFRFRWLQVRVQILVCLFALVSILKGYHMS